MTMSHPIAQDRRFRLAALAGAATGLVLALLFGTDLFAALQQGWNHVVLPAFNELYLAGFAICP
ncbi:MAG: hypothetical protein ACM3N5_13070 [Candidatus Eiseniibacteriota bacterium]